MTRRLMIAATLVALVSACTTVPKSEPTPTPTPEKVPTEEPPKPRDVGPDDGSTGEEDARAINITPFTKYSDEWAEGKGDGGIFSDAYTRLIVQGTIFKPAKKRPETETGAQTQGGQEDAEADVYPYQPRGWLARYFLGKHYGINFTVKVTTGAFEATIPMFTIDHVSNSEDGEQWNRVIYHSTLRNPWFLVKADGGNSVTTVRFSLKGSEQYSSAAAASAVQVALGVAKAVAPEAAVITSLSQQSTKDKARAIDDAIGKLFGSGLAEEHWTDRDIFYWTRAKGAKVVLTIPGSESGWDSKDKRGIGSWVVTFDDPRPSIFADWRICGDHMERRCAPNRKAAVANVYAEIQPAQVLSYKLIDAQSSLGTMHSYLATRDWFAAGQAELASNPKSAAAFCRRIRTTASDLGLSTVDVDIVVWAVVNGMPMPETVVKALKGDEDCKQSLDKIDAAE